MMTPPPSTPRSLLVGLLLLSLLFAGCVARSGGPGPALERILGDPAQSGLSSWPGPFHAGVTTFDLDGDGVDEVIAHSKDRNVYVFNSDTGRAVAVLPTTYPPAWHIQQLSNGVDIAVLEPGQAPSIVVANHAAYITAWQFVQTGSTAKHFVFEKSWERRMDECHRSPSMDAGAVLADLDGDGTVEVLVNTEEIGLYALRSDGTTLWSHCWSGGNAAPTVADLNGDGAMEAIFASDSGRLRVLDGASGAPRWTFDATAYGAGVFPGSIPVAPVVAELDGEFPREVLFIARVAPYDDPDLYADFHMAIFAVRQNASTYQSEVVWMRQPEWANPLSYTRLAVHDVDGDGAADIFGMDWNTIGHRPGDWERLGPANVFRLDAQGNDVWVREIDAWWSNHGIAIADYDGNGKLEILANGPKGADDGVWRLSAETGAASAFVPIKGWKLMAGPLFVDLHNDGSMKLLYPVVPPDPSVVHGGIALIDLGVPFDAPWKGSS